MGRGARRLAVIVMVLALTRLTGQTASASPFTFCPNTWGGAVQSRTIAGTGVPAGACLSMSITLTRPSDLVVFARSDENDTNIAAWDGMTYLDHEAFLAPGQERTLTVPDLQPGDYELVINSDAPSDFSVVDFVATFNEDIHVIDATPATLGAIPNSVNGCGFSNASSRDVTFDVSGVTGEIVDVAVRTRITHTFVGELTGTLLGPPATATSAGLFGRVGATTVSDCGDSSDTLGLRFADWAAASPTLWSDAAGTGAAETIDGFMFQASDFGGVGGGGTNQPITSNFTGIDPNGTWTLRVTDLASGGETGTVNSAVLEIVTVDTTEPQSTITSKPRATIKSKKKSVNVAFAFTANEPATFECKLDGATFAPCTSPKTYRVRRGSHHFEVRATDASNNVESTPSVHNFRIKKKR